MSAATEATRLRLAQSKGFPSYYAYRTANAKAKGYEKGYPEQRAARAGRGKLAPGDRPGRVSQPRREQTNSAGMRIVTSRDASYLRKQLRQAGNVPVVARLTVTGTNRRGETIYRTVEVGTGRDAERDAVLTQGVQQLLTGAEWEHVTGKVQLIFGRGSQSAAELLPPKAQRSRGGRGGARGGGGGGGGGGGDDDGDDYDRGDSGLDDYYATGDEDFDDFMDDWDGDWWVGFMDYLDTGRS